MFRNGTWRIFLAGMLCGAILVTVVGAAWVWWKPVHYLSDVGIGPWNDWRPVRSAEDETTYDMCLAGGNTVVACDALMRVLERSKAAETALRDEAAKLLAAGFSKCDVVKWGYERGFVGSQMSKVVGVKEFNECSTVSAPR